MALTKKVLQDILRSFEHAHWHMKSSWISNATPWNTTTVKHSPFFSKSLIFEGKGTLARGKKKHSVKALASLFSISKLLVKWETWRVGKFEASLATHLTGTFATYKQSCTLLRSWLLSWSLIFWGWEMSFSFSMKYCF